MSKPDDSSHTCKCNGCGNDCRGKEKPEPPLGYFAARPWIWIVIGYVAMVGALGSMVTIAIKYQQPDVLVPHGH